MREWALLLAALAALPGVIGCGSADEDAPGEPAPHPTLAVPAPGDGFQIDEGTFSVESGREALFCARYPMPKSYGDAPVFLRGVESILPIGTHHFFMSYAEGVLDKAVPCSGSSALLAVDDPEVQKETHNAVDGKLAFTSAVGKGSYLLPAGYGVYLATGLGHFSTSHHILNLTADTESLYGLFNVYTAPASKVPHPVNILNCLLRDVSVPPHSEVDIGGTCIAPFDLDLVVLSSHAHQYLQRFEMKIFDGEKTLPDVLYESSQWDSPKIVPLEKPIALKQGQGLTFSCHYGNATDEPIVYGAGDHMEMCAIMSAYAYPADRVDDVPPSLGGVVFTEGETTPLYDTTDIDGNF